MKQRNKNMLHKNYQRSRPSGELSPPGGGGDTPYERGVDARRLA